MATKLQKTAAMPKPTPSMCCISINYQDFLLPTAKGLQLVEIMKDAVQCERRYEGKVQYVFGELAPEVQLNLIKPGQFRQADPSDPINFAQD